MKKFIILTTLTLISSLPVLAQGVVSNNPVNNNPLPSYTLLEPLPCIPSPAAKDTNGNVIPGSEVTCSQAGAIENTVNFKFYVQYMFNLFIAIAAGAAVFMIVYGGLKYMSTDSWNDKSDGLEKMRNAIYGLILILASYLILRTIDPRLVAIPTTLVPALNIKYEAVNSSIFAALRKDSEKLAAKTAETRDQLIAAEARNENRQKEIDATLDEIEKLKARGATNDDPEVKALGAKVDTLHNEIKREEAEATLVLANSSFDNAIYGVNPLLGNKGPNDFDKLRENLDHIYNAQIEKLKAANAEPDQIKAFERYKVYSKLIIEMNEVVGKVSQDKIDYDSSITLLKTDVAMNKELAEKQKQAEIDIRKIIEIKGNAIKFYDPALYTKLIQRETELKEMLSTIRIN